MFKYIIQLAQLSNNMEQFLTDNNIVLHDGKIDIPDNIKHVKLDIGLSYNAPHSQLWLSNEDDLLVFGFEPHPDCIKSINKGAVKRHHLHGEPLNPEYINKKCYIIPCALGLQNSNVGLYSTKSDVGCSSIFKPTNINDVDKVIDTRCYRLDEFLKLIPFDQIGLIEYIKIDAQGSDLNIIKSGGKYIQDYVAVVTLEAENSSYEDTCNSEKEICEYMSSIGFARVENSLVSDPTFINNKFRNLNIYYEQCS